MANNPAAIDQPGLINLVMAKSPDSNDVILSEQLIQIGCFDIDARYHDDDWFHMFGWEHASLSPNTAILDMIWHRKQTMTHRIFVTDRLVDNNLLFQVHTQFDFHK